MKKAAILLAIFGATFFSACDKQEKATGESKQTVTTPSGDQAEVKTDTTVTTETE